MIREPYYNSRSSTIKPKNSNNYTLITYDLPITTPILFPPRQLPNDTIRTHRHHIHHRRDSIEPYYTKPRRNTGLPPVILNQFTYKENDSEEESCCAIISDSEDEPMCNIQRAPPPSLRKVSDCYSDEDSEEEVENLVVKPIKLPKVERCNIYEEEEDVVRHYLLNQVNNPNVLFNSRARTLSNELSPPKFNSSFLNDNYDVVRCKSMVRDDYDVSGREYLI
ncbi:hypothetical protein JA1_001977 [Spathaspora sp. JA1]|nr:hypothetical protein JA1_001977 [Spathaspora sp. JA1]